jgi:general secretion pathway protein I
MVNYFYKSLMNKSQQSGLTLIEVMVSVAILAFSLSALVKMTGQSANTLSYLEKKTFAQWVASNQINQIRANNTWLPIGQSQGKELMGGVTWYWTITTSNTDVSDLRRLEISVQQNQQDEPVYSLTAFKHKP